MGVIKILYNKITSNLSFFTIISMYIFLIHIFYKSKLPYIKKRKIKKNIKYNLENNRYFLQYQPIINPKYNTIIGFEGLLRLKKGKEILTPYQFIREIEDNEMMFETSLYILKQAINDYYILKSYNNMKDNNFYISLNMSLTEIENSEFIKKLCCLSKSMNMKKNSICIEILEKVRINDLDKINASIKHLKKYGFIIAIDDFGVEYSNLDILEKLDFDIVKIDKYFIDKIEKSFCIEEIIRFLAKVCKIKDKVLVCEGVEEESQKQFIESIESERLYIQGYYYYKPLNLSDIDKINID